MLALTMGDPAGIGPELSLMAWRALHTTGPAFVLLADPAQVASFGPARVVASPAEAAAVFHHAVPVLPVPLATAARPGHSDPANAPAVIASIDRRRGVADAVRHRAAPPGRRGAEPPCRGGRRDGRRGGGADPARH